MLIPETKSQPQRHTGGDNRNYHGQTDNPLIPEDASLQHQCGHTDIVHRDHASAENDRGDCQSKQGEVFARNGNINGRCGGYNRRTK